MKFNLVIIQFTGFIKILLEYSKNFKPEFALGALENRCFTTTNSNLWETHHIDNFPIPHQLFRMCIFNFAQSKYARLRSKARFMSKLFRFRKGCSKSGAGGHPQNQQNQQIQQNQPNQQNQQIQRYL